MCQHGTWFLEMINNNPCGIGYSTQTGGMDTRQKTQGKRALTAGLRRPVGCDGQQTQEGKNRMRRSHGIQKMFEDGRVKYSGSNQASSSATGAGSGFEAGSGAGASPDVEGGM